MTDQRPSVTGSEPIVSQRAQRVTAFSPTISAGAVSSALGQLLVEAADRAASLVDVAGTTVGETRAELRAAVANLLGQPATNGVPNGRRGRAVPRRHVDALRSELLILLSQSSTPFDGREIVTVLSALEDLAHRTEQTSTGKFVARLSGAESVNAVVEIAHDIRSPLSSILFLVEMIHRGRSGPVTPVQERQLGLVYSAALGLSTLASDLIDAVRGERLVDGRPIPFSVTEMMLSVCAIVQPIGEEKGLPMNVTFPVRDGRLGYPSAINRVLLNLTSNALRYTDSGSVSVGCTEGSEESDHRVEFWVKDTGRGIPDSVLGMLFDGFRPGSVGMRFSSAGLGLAICRTLLEAMGSELKVETSPEGGTRFSFVIDLPSV